MYIELLKSVVAQVRRRVAYGDCPPGGPLSSEVMEDAIVQLAEMSGIDLIPESKQE